MFVESGCSAEFLRVSLHPRRDFFVEEILYAVGLDGIKLSVHGDANAFLTLFQTERTGKRDFVRQSMFRDEPLKLFHNLS